MENAHHSLTVSSNGTIFIPSSATCGTNSGGMNLLKSTNGGQSFTVACIYDNYPNLFPSSPNILASSTNPNDLWMIFSGCTVGTRNCGGYPFGTDTWHVYSMLSKDAGATWSIPIRVDDHLSPEVEQYWRASASISSTGRIDVLWYDFRNSGGNFTRADVYYAYSIDGGLSYATNIRVTPAGPYYFCGSTATNNTCGPLNDYLQITSLGAIAYGAFAIGTTTADVDLLVNFAKIST